MRTLALSLLLVAAAARADSAAEPAAGAPYPVKIAPGERFLVCKSGQFLCPATAPICDDPSIAIPDQTPTDGLAWKAVGKGTTLCSAASLSTASRRIFRVTVE